MTENTTITDISDKSWNDLMDADHSILRELASERDDVNGNGSSEEIAAGLLRSDGRADEVPDEYRADESDEADAEADERDEDAEDEPADAEADADTDDDEDGDTDESEASETDESFGTGANPEPRQDATFIVQAGRLKTWTDYIDALVDECKIHLTDGGIETRAVDPANVGMVDANVNYDGFESYNIGGEGVIGLNITRLKSVLKEADADQLVNIDYDGSRKNLVLTYGGHEFTLALIDPASIRKEPDLPELDLPVRVEMDADDLGTAVSYTDQVTDHVRFAARAAGRDSTFEIGGDGDTDSYEWTGDGEDVTFLTPPSEDVLSLFSLDYVKDIVKPYDTGQTVTIDLGSEYPTKLATDLTDDDTTFGSATYMVAPRIQSD